MESNQDNIYAYCTFREHNLYSNIFILKHRYSGISNISPTLFTTDMPRTWKKKKKKERQVLEQQSEFLCPNQRTMHQPEGQQWDSVFSLSKWWGPPPSLSFKGTPVYCWILCPGWIMTKLQKAAQRSRAFGFQASHFKKALSGLGKKKGTKALGRKSNKNL